MLPIYTFGQNVDLPFDNHPLWMRQPYAKLLDLTALATSAQNYDYVGIPIPNSSSINFGERETKEGTITVSSHSYLLSIGGWSSSNEGYSFSVRDKGAKDFLFSKRFIKGNLISNGIPPGDNTPFAITSLLGPYIALTPGQFDWAITSLSPNSSQIQVVLNFVTPINDENRNKLAISN